PRGGPVPRPWLLIDIDGVLNPHPRRPTDLGPGWRTTRLVLPAAGLPASPFVNRPADGSDLELAVWFHPDHGRRLRVLADRFDLAWATTWEGLANDFYGPLLGLDPLPV